MATFTKHHLSGSTGGTPIFLSSSSGQPTTIHTTGTSDTVLDEIWLYAHNNGASDSTLNIGYGTSAGGDSGIEVTVTAGSGLMLAVPGLLLSGDGTNAKTVSAYVSATGVNITGYVNRIS